jgi:3-hydroxyisobutyrate dehydrogenase-like beta-hydroxyacid dehydrogenase
MTMKIALIGYGEVGRILAEDLSAAGHVLTAYDLKLSLRAGDEMREHARAHAVTLASSHADAVRPVELVVSAVTADQTVTAAAACADALRAGSFFLDFNSASPRAKKSASEYVARARGRYVEGAVMSSVSPHRLKVPLLLGGPHAVSLQPVLSDLGFVATVASETLGVASATKLCRSVIVKGLEALVIESFMAARHYGVEDAVIASLERTFPGIDWEAQGAYFFQRVIEHGHRRSEEMKQAVMTVHDTGLEPLGAATTAMRQAWIADLSEQGTFGDKTHRDFARSSDWRTEADRVLAHLRTVNGA